MAEPHYDSMIGRFGEDEIKEFVTLLTDRELSARLSLNSCVSSFRSLAVLQTRATTNQISLAALQKIIGSTDAQIPSLGRDTSYKRIIDSY